MTAVLAELGLPAEGPIYYGWLAPFKGGLRNATSEAMAAFHLAEYFARLKPYEVAMYALVDATTSTARGGPDAPPDVADAYGASIRDSLEPALTAWTAAAALRGWTGTRIGEALDDGDTVAEFAWQWLAEWLSGPGDEIDGDTLRDLIDRLTVEPQRREVEGQLSLDFSGRR